MKGAALEKTKVFSIKRSPQGSSVTCNCDKCTNTETIDHIKLHMPPLVIAKKFNMIGWQVDMEGRTAKCPICLSSAAKKKLEDIAKSDGYANNGFKIVMPTNAAPPEIITPIQEAEKMPELQREPRVLPDLARITQVLTEEEQAGNKTERVERYLSKVIDDDGYKDGWDDGRVAKLVGCSTALVANVRVNKFFKKKARRTLSEIEGEMLERLSKSVPDDTAEKLNKRIIQLEEEVKSLRRDMEQRDRKMKEWFGSVFQAAAAACVRGAGTESDK